MESDDCHRVVRMHLPSRYSSTDPPRRDRIAAGIRKALNLTEQQLSLAQILESATWTGGREIAKQKRPQTGGPPIEIDSDGTVF